LEEKSFQDRRQRRRTPPCGPDRGAPAPAAEPRLYRRL